MSPRKPKGLGKQGRARKLWRMFQLLRDLSLPGGGFTMHQLAERLRTTVPIIRRDLTALNDLGHRLKTKYVGHQKYWTLARPVSDKQPATYVPEVVDSLETTLAHCIGEADEVRVLENGVVQIRAPVGGEDKLRDIIQSVRARENGQRWEGG